MVAEWREAFHWLARQRFIAFRYADVIVDVAMKSPLADTGNCYGAVKAAIDGLVDAGVLPGDTHQFIRSIKMNAPVKVEKGQREFMMVTLEGESL